MFIFRLASTSYISCVGMDYTRNAMFVITLYSPDDKVSLDYNTSRYPIELVKHLKEEKEKIDEGFYSIRTWQMELYDNTKSRKSNYLSGLGE